MAPIAAAIISSLPTNEASAFLTANAGANTYAHTAIVSSPRRMMADGGSLISCLMVLLDMSASNLDLEGENLKRARGLYAE